MAIYHLSTKSGSRGDGKSAVASASYRSGDKLFDERIEKTFDYQRKQNIDHKEIMLPKDAPEWAKDRGTLWNEVEASEKRKDARVYREVEVALPSELSEKGKLSIVREFAKQNFLSKGIAVDFAIHEMNGKNPHAHIMVTTRKLEADGFNKKKYLPLDKKQSLEKWRESWEVIANKELKAEGLEVQISHKSNEDQGIELLPSVKVGAKDGEKRGEFYIQARRDRNEAIKDENARRIEKEPMIAVEALRKSKPKHVFEDLKKFIKQKVGKNFKQTMDAVVRTFTQRNKQTEARQQPEKVKENWLNEMDRQIERIERRAQRIRGRINQKIITQKEAVSDQAESRPTKKMLEREKSFKARTANWSSDKKGLEARLKTLNNRHSRLTEYAKVWRMRKSQDDPSYEYEDNRGKRLAEAKIAKEKPLLQAQITSVRKAEKQLDIVAKAKMEARVAHQKRIDKADQKYYQEGAKMGAEAVKKVPKAQREKWLKSMIKQSNEQLKSVTDPRMRRASEQKMKGFVAKASEMINERSRGFDR